jgi:L-threonylcarbamoyladenylate synthase
MADETAVARAGARLAAGGLVAFPTETVYGLGADATNGRAVAAVFAAKGRPSFNPLIVHTASVPEAMALGRFDARAQALAERFWPAPLTLIVERAPRCPVSELATVGLPTIALRVPAHPVAQRLLQVAGRPVAAPSANRSGHVSPTDAPHVAADLGDCDVLILDGGATPIGIESTVVDMTSQTPRLLRPGGVTSEALEEALGRSLERVADDAAPLVSPGQLASHYAPRARVRLAATMVAADEALLAFGPDPPPHIGPAINLSPTGDLFEAAANLFAALRGLDSSGATSIAVMPIPERSLGEAINDRLRRAAAPR